MNAMCVSSHSYQAYLPGNNVSFACVNIKVELYHAI